MAKKKVNKIAKFIEDNKLDFTGIGSDLNGNCVILAGYACYLELEAAELVISIFGLGFTVDALKELERVFNYAKDNKYGKYWKSKAAKKTYKF